MTYTYKDDYIDALKKLKNKYEQEHPIKSKLSFLGHSSHIDFLITSIYKIDPKKNSEWATDILDRLKGWFEAGSMKYFPDDTDRQEKFIKKLNEEKGHVYYLSIAEILKDNNVLGFDKLKSIASTEEKTKTAKPSQ